MPAVQIVALEDVSGKQAQLAGRAAALALQARLGQAGFLGADLGDRFGARLDLVGDGVQESGAILSAGVAEAEKRSFRSFGGARHKIRRADTEIMRRAVRGVGAERILSGNPFPSLSGACHAACACFRPASFILRLLAPPKGDQVQIPRQRQQPGFRTFRHRS